MMQCQGSLQQTAAQSDLILLCAGKLTVNSPKRAAQLRKAIEKLGPAYVKVAQAVSTRGDVLDLNYLREIERLQDRVPPFPTKAALPIMAEGQPSALLTHLSFAVLQDQFVVLHTSHQYLWLTLIMQLWLVNAGCGWL